MTGRGASPLLGALVGRFVGFVATLAGVVALVLVLLTLSPGDPIDLLPNAEEVRPVLEAEWHLDRPVPERYLRYLARLGRGDLGTSLAYRPGLPVAEVVAGPALRSAGWLAGALVLAMVWGGALAALTTGRRSALRPLVQVVSLAPVFLLAHLVVSGVNAATFAGMEAGWIDRPGWFALPDQPSAVRTALAVVLLAVGSGTLSEVHQAVEDALGRILRSGYVDAARARGAPIWPHVALNLVPPLTTIAATRAAFLAGGLVVLERVLLLNGAGSVLWQAALLRDYDLATALVLLAAAFVATARLVGDAVRVAVDPRLRSATGPGESP